MEETLSEIHSRLVSIIADITYIDYDSSPLIAYVNDSLSNLCVYLSSVISLKKD